MTHRAAFRYVTSPRELAIARRRMADCEERPAMTDGSAVGSDLDSWVEEEGLLEHAQAVAAKRALAFQIAEAMREHLDA